MAKTKRNSAPAERTVPDVRHALCWTPAIAPDLAPPSLHSSELVKGFMFNAYGDWPRVERACTSSIYHAFGTDEKTTSQGTRHLYSTRLLALKAMRHAVEFEVAKKLHKIDGMIADEMKNV